MGISVVVLVLQVRCTHPTIWQFECSGKIRERLEGIVVIAYVTKKIKHAFAIIQNVHAVEVTRVNLAKGHVRAAYVFFDVEGTE